jgi:ABC-type polysaccharide/polyol phosphate transport system ATPase subunit
MERMTRFREQGVTFVFVSHALETVAQLCERVVWIDGGRIRADGPAAGVLDAFLAGMAPPPVAAAPPSVRSAS